MKTLILVRHAKSDSPEGVEDFDRPLSERGHQDAPKMAHYLLENGISIDEFVTSPAKRALTTCRYFAEVFQNKNILKAEELYHASTREFFDVISNLDDRCSSVAIFSHNNGISNFATQLASEPVLFPTCGVAVFQADCEEWSLFEGADKKLLHFFEPKKI